MVRVMASDDDASDHGLDDYQSNDEAREKFDDENEKDAWARYETRSSGFKFTVDGENMALRSR